jgi:hypothetical protein
MDSCTFDSRIRGEISSKRFLQTESRPQRARCGLARGHEVRESIDMQLEIVHLQQLATAVLEGGRAAWTKQSPSEQVAVALILNRPDWLASIDCTLCEAIERLSPMWRELVPVVERNLRNAKGVGAARSIS